jgi:hypothetical protein
MTTTEPSTPVHSATCTETRTVTFTCRATQIGAADRALNHVELMMARRWKALEAQGAVLGPVIEQPQGDQQ